MQNKSALINEIYERKTARNSKAQPGDDDLWKV